MRKSLKAIFTLTLTLSLLSAGTVIGNAETDMRYMHNPKMYDSIYQKDVSDLKNKAEEYVGSINHNARVGGHRNLSVPLKKQMNGHYCGPASARMVLLYHGIDKTQSHIGSNVGTTSAGTYLYRITDYLNSQVGSGSYESVGTWTLGFSDGLVYSIDHNKPLICLVKTGGLPSYNGHNSTHYVVATGYDWSMAGSNSYSTVNFNDPNNNSAYYGRQTCTWSEMSQAIDADQGWYIMGK